MTPILATKGGRKFLIDSILADNPDMFSGFYLKPDGSVFEKTATTGEGGRYNFHRSHFAEKLP